MMNQHLKFLEWLACRSCLALENEATYQPLTLLSRIELALLPSLSNGISYVAQLITGQNFSAVCKVRPTRVGGSFPVVIISQIKWIRCSCLYIYSFSYCFPHFDFLTRVLNNVHCIVRWKMYAFFFFFFLNYNSVKTVGGKVRQTIEDVSSLCYPLTY